MPYRYVELQIQVMITLICIVHTQYSNVNEPCLNAETVTNTTIGIASCELRPAACAVVAMIPDSRS